MSAGGCPAYLVDDESEVKPEWLEGVHTVAVTAGASAPEDAGAELWYASLARYGFHETGGMELKEEDVRFSLPGELAAASARLTTINTASYELGLQVAEE